MAPPWSSKTTEVFRAIVTSSQKVTDLVGEIASASQEQAQGINQIDSGLSQVDKVTQQNTAHAEETAAAAEELSNHAQKLREIVSRLKKNDQADGSKTGALPAPVEEWSQEALAPTDWDSYEGRLNQEPEW